MYKWFFAWRYLRTRLIALFGIISVTLCVALVLVVLSVMGGFLDTLRERARGLLADIVIDSGSLQGWPMYGEFQEYLEEEMPDVVEATTPVIYNYGVLRVPKSGYTVPIRAVGIRMHEYSRMNNFMGGLHYNHYFPGTTTLKPQLMPQAQELPDGTYLLPPDYEEANDRWRASETDPENIAEFDADPFKPAPYAGERVLVTWNGPPGYYGEYEFPGVIVGTDVINSRMPSGKFTRYVPRGELISLNLVPFSVKGNMAGDPIRIACRYADDSRTGVFEQDKMCVYVDFEMLQQRLGMDPQKLETGGMTRPRTTQLLVSLKPGQDLHAAREAISVKWMEFLATKVHPTQLTADERSALDWVSVKTWEDLNRTIIAAVEKEKVLVTMLFGLISLVAIVLIGCIFYMIVSNKTRDIGVLKSLGASGVGVATLFITYAAVVGVVGAVLGSLLGATFVHYINEIQDYVTQFNPQFQVWSPEVYSFDRIPNTVKTVDVVWIGVVAILSSMVGALIPATIAGRVWPVAALRYE
jgi:lipoprotein-releasing system permease protein